MYKKQIDNWYITLLIQINKTSNHLNNLIIIDNIPSHSIPFTFNDPYYLIILINKKAKLTIDFTDYQLNGLNILFLSPFQLLKCHSAEGEDITIIKFHSDFYCIEYHNEEVSCNGVLFNNIYEKPFFPIDKSLYQDIIYNLNKLRSYSNSILKNDISISRSYLQLILALCSKEKHKTHEGMLKKETPNVAYNFKKMLEENFIQYKPVAYYAQKFCLSSSAFNKKVKAVFYKPPSKLIKERIILEAKKKLHLTFASIKEIAFDLGLKDEFYFSRFFKKEVGVSPKYFREKTGISIVAK